MNKFHTVKQFYRNLKTSGMSQLMSKERDEAYLNFLKSHLKKSDKILDLACGYGRLTFPLNKQGHNIEGIDLAPNFIKDAKLMAKQKKIDLKFKVGNMLNLPYTDASFDKIICMWSSFNHLLTIKDQVKSLNEMYRVLKTNGLAIIDMPIYKITNGQHLVKDNIGGYENTDFIHNRASLIAAIGKSKVKKYKVKIEDIGGRKRLVLYLYK